MFWYSKKTQSVSGEEIQLFEIVQPFDVHSYN